MAVSDTPTQQAIRHADDALADFAAQHAESRRACLTSTHLPDDTREYLTAYAARMERVAQSLRERGRTAAKDAANA